MADPILPGDPVPVVPVSREQQFRRCLGWAVMAVGVLLRTVAENAPAIQHEYPGLKWLGSALFLASLGWKAWQSATDIGKVQHVDLSPAAATVSEYPEDGPPTP